MLRGSLEVYIKSGPTQCASRNTKWNGDSVMVSTSAYFQDNITVVKNIYKLTPNLDSILEICIYRGLLY